MGRRQGRTLILSDPPHVMAAAAVVGKKEGEGPLAADFDVIEQDSYCGQKTWEKAESTLQKRTADIALTKAGVAPGDVDIVLAGDLLNQCTASCFGLVELGRPMLGLFGACSTAAEGLAAASLLVDGGFARTALTITSSHFCTAERQFRLPLSYGGQRPPTAQWTVTGAAAFVLGKKHVVQGAPVRIKACAVGVPVDMGIADVNNMGAAMAPAAIDTLSGFFTDTGTNKDNFDLIVTGDLGAVGHAIVAEKMGFGENYNDCGLMVFDLKQQDVHAGGSGCGCSAVVTAGHILRRMRAGELKSVLLVGTGALMSTTSFQQGENIIGIAHLVWLSAQ
ncbi:MAG TPA: stage V sporulation protein AD [Terriglobales bacterium]|nr:stage V sporulation protein AD [Terriglobales bacterium]